MPVGVLSMADAYQPQPLRRLLTIQLAAIVFAAMVAFVLSYYAVGVVQERAEKVAAGSRLAVLSADSEAHMSLLIEIMTRRTATFLTSPEALALSAEEQGELRRGLLTPEATVTSPNLVEMLVPLSLTEAIQFQRSLATLEVTSATLLGTTDEATAADVQDTRAVLTAYFVHPTVANFESFTVKLNALRTGVQLAIPTLSADATKSQDSLTSLTSAIRWGVIVMVLGLASGVLIVVLMSSRSIHAFFERSNEERDNLRDAGEELRYRNNQLNALYNVFNEISDTLSLRYVVNATVKEALNLVNADVVVLRLVRDGKLVVAQSLGSDGEEVPNLSDLELGEGPVGRVAKRGRATRIEHEAFGKLIDGQRVDGLRSGVIVPLIVGARVVGTLGCWSRQDVHFSEDDERILLMMASQVATAVVAADSNEISEHRAQHDALTGLPNRRQVEADIAGDLRTLLATGGSAVVAMVDIDRFKRFNDDFGHRVGDVTLQKVAAVLRTSVRDEDRVYRLGGEEFLIVFVDAGPSDALVLAERVRAAVASTPLTGDTLEPVGPVTISIGLSLTPQHSADFTELIEMADVALYRAKETGRNRVVLSDGGKPAPRELLSAA